MRGEVIVALVFLMAISLSMDAFSLALAYGTLGMSNKDKITLSLIVGLFHLIMPFLGMFIGEVILSLFKFNTDMVVAIILSFIGIQMIISSFKKEEEIKLLNFSEFLLFGLAVSIDSLTLGITLPNMEVNTVLSPFVFAIISSIFTFIGLFIGNKIEKLLGKIATIIGGIILTLIGIVFAI